MGNALMVALVGMFVVFAVLVLIIFCIKLYTWLIGKSSGSGKKKGHTENKTVVKSSDNMSVPVSNNPVSAEVDTEIAAVITAAIMACMQDSGSGLKVRSIRRIGHNTPIWNVAGRNEYILSRM